MSLQTLAVLLIAATFGLRLGVATLLLYMAEGAAGFPVFQSTPEKGIGIAYMLGSTGGYLAGFVVMAAIVGWAADRGWDRTSGQAFRRHAGRRNRHDGDGLCLAGAADRRRKSRGSSASCRSSSADLIKVALASALVPAVWALAEASLSK